MFHLQLLFLIYNAFLTVISSSFSSSPNDFLSATRFVQGLAILFQPLVPFHFSWYEIF